MFVFFPVDFMLLQSVNFAPGVGMDSLYTIWEQSMLALLDLWRPRVWRGHCKRSFGFSRKQGLCNMANVRVRRED